MSEKLRSTSVGISSLRVEEKIKPRKLRHNMSREKKGRSQQRKSREERKITLNHGSELAGLNGAIQEPKVTWRETIGGPRARA